MTDYANDPIPLPDSAPESDAADAFAHGSLGRLSPAWWEPEGPDAPAPEPWLDAEAALDRFLGWTAARGIEPWPHQEEALMALMMGDHVVLGTPTGSGKSLVALGLCFMAMATGRRSYYTAPIKALVSEKFFDLVDILGRENVGMVTGDAHINAGAPVVCCTAEILANQALREGEDADVGCVAMDEFHYYGDYDRGWAWQVPLLTLPKTQFLLMSATLGDVSLHCGVAQGAHGHGRGRDRRRAAAGAPGLRLRGDAARRHGGTGAAQGRGAALPGAFLAGRGARHGAGALEATVLRRRSSASR